MTLDAELRRARANTVSMVYQDPGSALNPSIRVGKQVAEVFEPERRQPGQAPATRRLAILGRVQIADPGQVMERYPHQLSGGMQQRVAIAMAMAINPTLLILDEPTTGLDATVEAEVLDLIARLRGEFSTSILFISHNLAVIARMCDRVGVLYAGRLVEEGPTSEVFNEPRHPYTVGLLRCLPRRGRRKDQGRLDTIPGFLPGAGGGDRRLRLRRALRAWPTTSAATIAPLLIELAEQRLAALPLSRPRASSAAGHAGGSGASPIEIDRQPAPDAQRRRAEQDLHSGAIGCARWSTSPSISGPARPWGWSVNPAAARRPSPGCCWASTPPTPAA